MEKGRVIYGRYLLQRLIKQTAFCSVYQGVDQRLQRAVTVKSVLAANLRSYRTALKMTANFSHPHIIGLSDLVIEPESLYIVQEYVDGESFETLVQHQLTPFEVADAGWQICLALMYAGSSSRRVCHGDLVPSSVMRDRMGMIRINNFAQPTDLAYFQKWCTLGGEDLPLLETTLPPGQQSDARKADDTRAAGLLLYQMLTGSMESPPDGRLRFSRLTPPELCETVARVVVRQHPQHINTPEVLYAQLKALAELFEPPLSFPPAEESSLRQLSSAGVARSNPGLTPSPLLPSRENEPVDVSTYSTQIPGLEVTPSSETVGNVPFNSPVQQAGYSPAPYALASASAKKSGPSALIVLLLCLIVFLIFFAAGYSLAHFLIH